LRGDDLRRALAWLTQASETTKPVPTTLQIEYVRMSQEAETYELDVCVAFMSGHCRAAWWLNPAGCR
jgi:hypothetical protein